MASTLQQPVSLQTDDSASGDTEIAKLTQEVQRGQFDGLRDYLANSRTSGDWQDRVYVLERIAPKVSIDALEIACTAEPDAVDLLLTRCAYYAELAKTMRGTGTSDQVGSARFQNAAACVRASLTDMTRSTQIDSEDPTAYTLVLKPLTIFSQTELQQKAFAKATAIAPGFVSPCFALIPSFSKRWGGSHEASLAFARQAMTKAAPGSDMAACLFWAHTLVRTHFLHFDKDVQSAKRYASRSEVVSELNAALDGWLAPCFTVRRSSIPFLHKASEWYRAVIDIDRLDRVIAVTGEERKLPAEAGNLIRRTTSAQKSGGGLLGWILGGR
jgi:Arc/MetJ-type ribon-helix-helix transcriptional regulator